MRSAVLRLLPATVLTVAVTVLAACGADADTSQPAGKRLATEYGCAACHGADGEGGLGPKWIGLYGSQVTLQDGTTVTADEAYIRRSIVDPNAQIPKGVTLPMPLNAALTPADIDQIVAYIESLAK